MFHVPKKTVCTQFQKRRLTRLKASHAPKRASHVPKKTYTHNFTLCGETLITFRENKIRYATGVVANLESESQRGSNHPATRSYRAVKNPSPNRETLQDSD